MRKMELRQARRYLGYTLESASKLIGVHFQTLRNWELGSFIVPNEMRVKIEEVYGVAIKW